MTDRHANIKTNTAHVWKNRSYSKEHVVLCVTFSRGHSAGSHALCDSPLVLVLPSECPWLLEEPYNVCHVFTHRVEVYYYLSWESGSLSQTPTHCCWSIRRDLGFTVLPKNMLIQNPAPNPPIRWWSTATTAQQSVGQRALFSLWSLLITTLAGDAARSSYLIDWDLYLLSVCGSILPECTALRLRTAEYILIPLLSFNNNWLCILIICWASKNWGSSADRSL